ncbi:P-type ATPase 2 [Cryptosporidium hominis TU502]|uniref:P-type ATPase 2 n=1 Tax=Cryptosporidium hominis (strain TU502) TaxID=353151 RepID=UPI0000453102|nr:P-type ATPase 2 [Cryptosporidium hominis TU502]
MNTMSIDSICLDDISLLSMEMKEHSSIINIVNVDLIDLGDVIILKKDEIVPYDGIVISNDIAVLDESMITGESRIIEKLYGNFISSGSRVLSDNVFIFVTEVGTESTLGKIQKLKIKARESQIELPGIIDIFSRYFVPSIILLSLLAFVVWFLLAYYDKVDPARMFITARITFIQNLIIYLRNFQFHLELCLHCISHFQYWQYLAHVLLVLQFLLLYLFQLL